MRIIIVGPFPPFRGGIADLNLGLATNLAKSHDVRIVNFTTQYPKIFFPGKSQFKADNFTIDISNERILSSINPFTWRKTANYILDLKPDLIVFRYWIPFFAICFKSVARRIKAKSTTRVIAICDNIIPHEERPFDKYLTKSFFRYVDRFLVMSKSVEKDLIKFIPNATYKYSPHPIYNIFGSKITKLTAREILNVSENNVILFFGLIRNYKGLDILIRAIDILKSRMNDFIVIVAGECYEDSKYYSELIQKLELNEYFDLNFRFIPDSELAAYFSVADVLALPYRSASQSGIIQIAYHYDLPVVVTNVGGLPEIVANGVTGYLAEPNELSIAEALEKFFNKRRNYDFSSSVRKYKKQFSWEKMVETIELLASE